MSGRRMLPGALRVCAVALLVLAEAACGRAYQFGLVNRVVPVETYLDEAMKLAGEIASRAPLAVRAAKKMINQAYEQSLTEGLSEEKEEFYNLFATEDQKEGMQAFTEKRQPQWKGR